jgi:AAA+ ATPase superfamily predicted ATPase
MLRNTHNFVKLKNPYTFGVPVRGEGKFFGREEELKIIFDTLENVPRGQKQDLVVMGPRRIGKSSLLYRLVDLLAFSQDFVPVYVDIQSIKPRTIRLLFFEILQRIEDGYSQRNLSHDLPAFKTLKSTNIPADLEFYTFKKDLAQINEAIATQNLPRLVLMFDEVELLIEFGGSDILGWFRGLIQSMLYTIFVVSGAEQLYSLTQDYGSPFYNIFKTVELRPLTSEAARNLVEKPAACIGMKIKPTEVNKILSYAGNTPYFIQGMAHYLVERLNLEERDSVNPEDVDKVIEQSIEHLSPQFAYIWGGISQVQRVILYALAKKGSAQTSEALLANLPQLAASLQTKQAQQDMFLDLVQQQILRMEKNDKYWFIVLLFVNWILSTVDDEEVINLATKLETTLEKRGFNTAAARELLSHAFDSESLDILAYDYFRPVYEQFSHGMTRQMKIQRLLEYVERNNEFEELLSLVERENPRQFEVFREKLSQ